MKHPLMAALAGALLTLGGLGGPLDPASPALAATPSGIGAAGKTEAAIEAGKADAGAAADSARDKAAGKAEDATRKAAPGKPDRSGGAEKPGATHDHAPSDSLSTTAPDNKAAPDGKAGGSGTINSQDILRDAKDRKDPSR